MDYVPLVLIDSYCVTDTTTSTRQLSCKHAFEILALMFRLQSANQSMRIKNIFVFYET